MFAGRNVVVFRGLVRGRFLQKMNRIEKDTMGPVEVPFEKYWGAQTQRSLVNARGNALAFLISLS
jgi:hypothetical protein